MNKKIKLLIAVIILFCVIMVGNFIIQKISSSGKISVKTVSAPKDTIIKVNGKTVGKNFNLSPGKYEIKGERDGFQSYKYDVVLSKGDSQKELFFVLVPESESALEWVRENQKEYIKVEQQAGEAAQEEGEKQAKDNPIINLLPYDQGYYRIDYGEDPDTKRISIQITGDAAGRQVALEKIRQWGYEPTDYKIEFRGFVSMFEVDGETISQ